jgi:hypothetical protein
VLGQRGITMTTRAIVLFYLVSFLLALSFFIPRTWLAFGLLVGAFVLCALYAMFGSEKT